MEYKLLNAYLLFKSNRLFSVLLWVRGLSFIAMFFCLGLIPLFPIAWKFSFLFLTLLLSFHWYRHLIMISINKITDEQIIYFPIYLREIKANQKFVKKYAKYFPSVFFDFNETDEETLKKALMGLKVLVGEHEIYIDDISKSHYVLTEIRQNPDSYKLIHGVYRSDPKNKIMSKKLLDQLAENIL